MTMTTIERQIHTAQITADLVNKFLANHGNSITASEMPNLVKGIFAALSGEATSSTPIGEASTLIEVKEQIPVVMHKPVQELVQQELWHAARIPAVPVNESITDEYIVCLEDGEKMKVLKRHIKKFGLSPEDYKERWGLPSNYPLIAPSYSRKRRDIAIRCNLGRNKAKG